MGSRMGRFSDGLVVQDASRGLLRLWVCRALSPGAPSAYGLLGPLASACTSEGIRRDTGIISWLHWPDLVTIEGRAVARTSLSLTIPPRPGAKARAIIEVSVNCSAEGTTFPPGLRPTSIMKVLGVEIDPVLLREKVLHALDWYLAEWERGMVGKLVGRIQPTISWMGEEVAVRMAGGETLRGKAVGLDEGGSLVLEGPGARNLSPELVEVVRLAD